MTPQPDSSTTLDPAAAGSLNGHAVLVTGGTKGIGATIARAFLAVGADVVVCARNEPTELPEANGRRAVFVAADVRDTDSQAALIAATTERLGRLDVLVNNAGGSPMADARTASPRFSASIIGLNLVAPFQLATAAYAVMAPQASAGRPGGQIINIGSVSGLNPNPGTAAYSVAKAGLTMATRALALEFAPLVRVNQVTVGLVQTELSHLHYGDQAGLDAVAATIPMKRMATPVDVAGACLLLCSPLAGYVNGAALLVDGGGEVPARSLAATAERPGAG